MKILQKIKSARGFSLGELLVTTLIMLLVSTVMVSGIPAARNAYLKVTLGANARVLLSTTVTALRNELGTACDVSVGDDKSVTYTSAQTGGKSCLSLSDTDGIMIQEYAGYDTSASNAAGKTRQLVSDAVAASYLYVTYKDVAIDTAGIITFSNLEVKCTDDATVSINGVGLESLQIRVIRDANN